MARYAKKLRLFPPSRVDVIVGDPVDLSAFRGRPLDQKTLVEATDLLMQRITELLEELRGEQPPRPGGTPPRTTRRRPASLSDERPGLRPHDDHPDPAVAAPGAVDTAAIRVVMQSTDKPRVAVIGAGSWGTTFAKVLAEGGADTVVWARRPESRGRSPRRSGTPTTCPASTCPAR